MTDLQKYFQEISGKDVSGEIGKFNNPQEIKNFLESVKNASVTSVAEGASKTCSVYNGYAILKSKEVYKKPHREKFADYDLCRFSEWLISKGVITPKLYSLFYADKHYFEVFENVEGSQLSVTSTDVILKGAFGPDYSGPGPLGYTYEEKVLMGNFIYNYNKRAQEAILKLPDCAFDKLLENYKFMSEIGFAFMDTNPGNVIVTNNEFKIIDIEYRQTLTNFIERLEILTGKKCTISDVFKKLETNPQIFNVLGGFDPQKLKEDLCENFVFAFCSSCWYKKFLNSTQIADLIERDVKVLKRVVDTLSRAGLDFDLEKSKPQADLLEALGGDYGKYMEVVESQIKLYNQKKTMR